MVEFAPEVDPARVDALLEARDLDGARALLARTADNDEQFVVRRIRLGLYDGSLEPENAMQRLIQLMRRNENFPGAKALYQEASSVAYQSRQSSVAHSHPPPPTGPRRDD